MDTKLIGADEPNPSTHPFLFSTGIENSYPVVYGRDGKGPRRRVDEMAKCGHYHGQRDHYERKALFHLRPHLILVGILRPDAAVVQEYRVMQ